MTEILGELEEGVEKIGQLKNEVTEAVEEIEVKLTKAYRTKKSKKQRETIWEETEKLEKILTDLNVPFETRARILLDGHWACYYLIQKFYPDDAGKIRYLATRIYCYYEGLDREEYSEIFVAWGYLYATAVGELKKNLHQRKEINDIIFPLAIKKGIIKPIADATNSRVLEAMTNKNFLSAIEIADEFTRDLLDKAIEYPKARLNAANIINNGALSRVSQSDLEEKTEKRIGFLTGAIMVGFDKAEKIYEEVVPPNLDHFNGLKNRLIMATIKILDAYGEEEPELKNISQQIQSEFSAKNRPRALEIIEETTEKYPRQTLINIKKILNRIDQFLETYQEENQKTDDKKRKTDKRDIELSPNEQREEIERLQFGIFVPNRFDLDKATTMINEYSNAIVDWT